MARFLPEWFPPSGEVERPTASEINDLATNEQTVTVAGYNEPVQFVYGEQQLSGAILTVPVVAAFQGGLVYAVALCRSGDRKFGGITGLMINGVDQNYSNVINSNPTTVTREDIAFRIYNGTQTHPDAALRQVFGDDFNDVFEDTAYAVIIVPNQKADDFNFSSSIIWTVRGRQCFDPRNNTWAWTENPSLHLYDFATCQKYGLARDVIGIAECADWNDSLYSGLPRARTGLVINEALEEYQIMDLLSTYAECLWSYEGDAIRVIADAPVDAPADTITKSQIRDGTFDIRGSDQSNVPTALSVIFSDRSRPAEWGSIPAHVQSPDHEVFGSISTQSDVQLLGVYRRIEAERRAWSRFMRLQVPGKISFQMFDDGIKYQLGDVIRIPDYMGVQALSIRITAQVEPVDIGVYQIHGEVYKRDFYPSGGTETALPKGGLMLSTSVDNRTGFTPISVSDDQIIFGGTQTGTASHSGQIPSGTISFTLSPTGEHSTPVDVLAARHVRRSTPVTDQGFGFGDEPRGYHSHSGVLPLSEAAKDSFVDKTTAILLESTTDLSPDIKGLIYFNVDDDSHEGSVSVTLGNGYISVSNVKKTVAAVKRVFATSSSGGGHNHAIPAGEARYWQPVPSTELVNFYRTGSPFDGEHQHILAGDVDMQLKSVPVYFKRITSADLLPKGAIIGYTGSDIPLGWALCDGSNDTPDLAGKALVDATTSTPFFDENKTTVKFPIERTASAFHKHNVIRVSDWFWADLLTAHTASVQHTHDVSPQERTREFAYVPRRFEIKFIQYIGE